MMIFTLNCTVGYSQWVSLYSGTNKQLNSVYFISSLTGWIAGDYGLILKTTNGGFNWINQDSRTNQDLFSVFFASRDTGWIVGYSGTILKTTNGGSYWSNYSSIHEDLYSVFFTDNNTGWAAGGRLGDGRLYVTTNSGINWTNRSQQGGRLYEVFFIDRNTGWIVGENGKISNTTNAGILWITQVSGSNNSLSSVHFSDHNNGWIVGNYGTIHEMLKTTNGGINWSSAFFSPENLSSVHFINNNSGWVVGNDIYRTSNGGSNWEIESSPPNFNLYEVFFTKENIGWIVGRPGMILKRSIYDNIKVTSIISPVQDSTYYSGCLQNYGITPAVEVKNFGTNNQNDFFDIHCEIKNENNVVWSRTKQDTISSGQIHTISFDNFYDASIDLDHSEYILKTWTSSPDTNFLNDSTYTTFKFRNHSYGYSEASNYYFINNTADAFFCTFQNAVFNWEDTTGSINLISNGEANFPFAAGNISNGCFRLTDVFQDEDKFKFFETCYDTVVISTNGIIGLGSSLAGMTSSNPVQIPSASAPMPAIFPFWSSFNFQDQDITGRNLKYKLSGNKLIITYDRVPAYNTVNDPGDYVSFQIILESGTDCSSENGKIKVQFDNTKSGSTFLNNYYNGNLNSNLVGIQNTDGTLGIQYRYSNSAHQMFTPGYLFGQIAVEFGHSIGVDPGNNVGVTNINIPKRDTILYTGCLTGSLITPKTTVKNFGTNNQNVPFNVECLITFNSDTVYSDISQDTLSSNESHFLEFEPFETPPDTGSYKIFVKTMLPGDTAHYNDTLSSGFRILNAHYGVEPYRGDAGYIQYHFANSTAEASCASDQPVFNWEDTTNSICLIANGLPVIPLNQGNIDDGSFYFPAFLTDFNFYYGLNWNVNVFTDGYLRLHGDNVYGDIMPFKCDLNFGDNDVVGRNLKYKIIPDKIIFTYDRVPLKNDSFDPEDYLTFQLILNISGNDDEVIVFQYDRAATGSTFLNKYMNNLIAQYQVGTYFSAHGGTRWGIDYRYKDYYGVQYNFGPVFEQDSIAVAFGRQDNVLPVELSSFNYSINNNNVQLSWSTAGETNNSGFDIERSNVKDQTSDSWIKIGNVTGNGNSNSPVSYTFEDKNLTSGKYKYRLKQIDFNGSFEYYDLQNEVIIGIPGKYNLSQNYPNPFNPVTKIDYDIAADSKTTLLLFDLTGRLVKTLVNEFKTAGYYSVDFNGTNLASGVYFYKLQTDRFSDTKRMVLLK